MIGHFRFAFNAADARCTATVSRPIKRLSRREEFVPVVNGANVGIAGISSPLTSRIGDHHLRLLADFVVRLAQRDGVAVGLRHLPPVKARYPGSFCEHRFRFGQNVSDREETRHFTNEVQEVLNADFGCFRPKQSFIVFSCRRYTSTVNPTSNSILGGPKCFSVLRQEQASADLETPEHTKATDDLAAEFNV